MYYGCEQGGRILIDGVDIREFDLSFLREKIGLVITLLTSCLLFLVSLYMSYVHIIPISIHFMTQSGILPETIGINLNFKHSVETLLQILFYAFLVFFYGSVYGSY